MCISLLVPKTSKMKETSMKQHARPVYNGNVVKPLLSKRPKVAAYSVHTLRSCELRSREIASTRRRALWIGYLVLRIFFR